MRKSATDGARQSKRPAMVFEVAAEIRWSFTRPWIWLRGVALNLVLSLAYLVLVPLSGHHRAALGVVVGSYFVNFILAEVTTTNVFGPDHGRTTTRLHNGESILRLLLVKNLTLILIVGVPTLVLTAALTEDEAKYSLAVAVPAVAFPLLCWIAFGDVVSVLLPIKPVAFRQRWRQRRHRATTGSWLAHYVVPYGLFFVIEYIRQIEHGLAAGLTHALGRSSAFHGFELGVFGLAIWAGGLVLATAVVTHRGLKFR